MKTCTKCKLPKDDDAFTSDSSKCDGLRSSCKQCSSDYWKQFTINRTPEQIRQQRVRTRKHELKTKYGLTVDEYQSILTQQNGVCAICGFPETSTRAKQLAVDHNHQTGEIRQLLCRRCNWILGVIDEDKSLLTSLFNYLVKHES